jgi:hypothetical protein
MKTKTEMDPTVAFPNPDLPPKAADLKAVLGPAAVPIEQVLDGLRAGHRAVGTAWQYSRRAGWYRIHLLKQRRLFYLVPKTRDFRVSLILGPRAVGQLLEGEYAGRTAQLLKRARRYPEGIAFSFNHETLDPDLLEALLEAKIAH